MITGALSLEKETRFEKKQIESLVPCPIILGIALMRMMMIMMMIMMMMMMMMMMMSDDNTDDDYYLSL